MSDIFLSYAREDQATARRFAQGLEHDGFSVWWDQTLHTGEAYDKVTETALREARAVVVLWSKQSVESRWVRAEATTAHRLGTLMPVMIEACERPIMFELTHTAELLHWRGDVRDAAWQAFVGDVRRNVRGAGPVPRPAPAGTAGIASAAQSPRRAWMAAGIALFVLMVGGLAMVIARFGDHARASVASAAANPAPLRIAVLPVETLGGDAMLQQFAGGLMAATIGKLSDSQVPVLARSQSTGLHGRNLTSAAQQFNFAYAFDSTAERDGKDLLVRMHLDDARQGATVWSEEFRADAGEAGALQDHIAATAALVARSALRAGAAHPGDTEAVVLGIKASLFSYWLRPEDFQAALNVGQRMVEKFPDEAGAHLNLALMAGVLAAGAAPADAAKMRELARREIARGLELAPHDPGAYWASANLLPTVGHWVEREKLLLTEDPARDANFESNFLREVGRLEDALRFGRMSQAPTPHSPNRDGTLLLALAATGRMNEAIPFEQEVAKSWPDHSAAWNARLETLVFARHWDEASALFAPGIDRPIEVDDAIAAAWRAALAAMKSGNRAARLTAARNLTHVIGPQRDGVAQLPHEVYDQGNAIAMMALLGDVDGAFKAARAYLKPDSFANSSFLFWPGLADFRADPRFMRLVADIGLVRYWQSSGQWPDYCKAADAPYDCKAQAARYPMAAAVAGK
jgi:TolB-like protein